MYKVIALIGKSASGKDSIAKELVATEPSAHSIISHTSRPKRDCEVDGKDYHFVKPEDFASMIEKDEIFEVTNFNGWWYGTAKESLREDKINVGVFNPEGVLTMLECDDVELTIYYVLCSDKTRIQRQLSRENDPDIKEIFRRYQTDDVDFQEHKLDFNYIRIENETSEDFFTCVETIRNINFK